MSRFADLTLQEYQQRLVDDAKKRYPDTAGHSTSSAPCIPCGDLDGCWVWCAGCLCGHPDGFCGCASKDTPHEYTTRQTGPRSLETPYKEVSVADLATK